MFAPRPATAKYGPSASGARAAHLPRTGPGPRLPARALPPLERPRKLSALELAFDGIPQIAHIQQLPPQFLFRADGPLIPLRPVIRSDEHGREKTLLGKDALDPRWFLGLKAVVDGG